VLFIPETFSSRTSGGKKTEKEPAISIKKMAVKMKKGVMVI